jgi:hypothetical protein
MRVMQSSWSRRKALTGWVSLQYRLGAYACTTVICTMTLSLSKNARGLLCVVAALVFLVAFGASILAIWVGGKYKPLSADQACPTLNLASLPANQVVFKKNVYEQQAFVPYLCMSFTFMLMLQLVSLALELYHYNNRQETHEAPLRLLFVNKQLLRHALSL